MEPRARKARRADVFSAGSAGSALIVLLMAVFLALHLPYLPKSLEDLDSINFALGVRQFDVAHHQPHPPGYPVYIALAKTVQAAVPDEARALGLVSVVSGGLGVLAMAALFLRLGPTGGFTAWVPAAVLAMTAPLYWFTAVRPLSDMAGLAAALAVQVLTIGAGGAPGLYVASFCAGLAGGLRSQVAWLTVPLLLWCATRHHPGRGGFVVARVLLLGVSFVAGTLVWGVPLVVLSGGPSAYWHALSNQGAEDLGNIQMLWTRHGARDVMDAFYYALVAPWAAWPVASMVLMSAALGTAWLWRHARPGLLLIAVAFGPYLIFDLLFQETFTSRYALPLVVPIAYLAAAGLRWAPREAAWLLAIPIVMFDAHVGGTSIAAYAQQKAPAFRLLDDMKRAADATGQRPVLAPDRRESFDLRRPIVWMGARMPAIVRQLPAPPQHEWLEAVADWNAGGRDPMWFLVDPTRSTIDLVQHGSPFEYRWPLPYPVLMSGVRPNDVDWYPVDRPEWFVGGGWALTPEAAGVAESDRRGPSLGPIEAWVAGRVFGGAILIGGRNFSATPATVTIDQGGRQLIPAIECLPGAFLRLTRLPNVEPPISDDYVRLTVRASTGSRIAIEQFDASGLQQRPIVGYGAGWHEQEFNPRTGQRWRWLSERGELPYLSPVGTMALHIEGESPRRYFSRDSRLIVRAGGSIVFNALLSSDFSLNIVIPAGSAGDPRSRPLTDGRQPDVITLETDQTYVPAERGWRRTADRRHLGLRVFKVELRPPS